MGNSFQCLHDFAQRELFENILPYWMKHGIDRQYGGFVGAAGRDGTPLPFASKGVVLNARILWTFSAAYRLSGKQEYRSMAEYAYDDFTRHFVDPEHGGAYTMLSHDGVPEDTDKMTYGQAFSIYALSEYACAAGDASALGHAMRIYELLEAHAYDPVHGGYHELFNRFWNRYQNRRKTSINTHPGSTKTMNTHLHLVEASTNLLRASHCDRVKAKAAENLSVLRDRIVDRQTGHYHMFFRDDWAPVSRSVSFGHDIEGSWLMTEAADALGDEDTLTETKRVSAELAKSCLAESIAEDGSMLYEYDRETGVWRRERYWWVQAEAVIGFLNAWKLLEEDRYLAASLKTMQYIDRCFIDHIYGEWYAMVNEDGTPAQGKDGRKIGAWKAPYHNARMCIEIIRRFEDERL